MVVRPSVRVMFLGHFSKTALSIFPIFGMIVEDNMAHCLSKLFEKFLISGVILVLLPLLQNSSKDLPKLLHGCRGQQGPFLEQDCFSEKILMPGLQGIRCPERCVFLFFGLYFKTALMIFPTFCMSVEDNNTHCLCKIVFFKKN